MTDGFLELIIQLEKGIQADVAAEQTLADQWQKRELAALEDSFSAIQANEEERCLRRLEEKRDAAMREGAALEAASASRCQRLAELKGQNLRNVLKRHLAAILPGGDYDHPNGQS